jgi:NitT/TauT family transport system substrate-binding protein
MKLALMRESAIALVLAASTICATVSVASAEVDQIRIAQQYGLGFLPLMIMKANSLFEKHAKEENLNSKAEWLTLGGPAAANDALLSGNVDVISNGPPSFIIMWGRTHNTPLSVSGIGPVSMLPMWLNTKDPNVHSLEDFTDQDRIAVTAVKTSIPAIIMQMWAAKKWGEDNYGKLDPLTTSLPHPDGMAALLSGTEITAHFTSPPYQYLEVKHEGIHRVATSYELMGQPATFTLLFGKDSFIKDNPKTVKALRAALKDAQDFIRKNPEEAADIYMKLGSEGGVTKQDVLDILKDPDVQFTDAPAGLMAYVKFLAGVGTIKNVPKDWKELFVEDVHGLSGN